MRNPWVWIVLWAGTLAGAWYLGSEGTLGGNRGSTAIDSMPVDQQVTTLQGEITSLKARLADRGPALQGSDGGTTSSATTSRATDAAGTPEDQKFEPVYEFTLEGIETAEQAVAHFLAYGKTMLSMGREGHLKFYEQIDAWAQDREFGQKMEGLFGRGERAARYMVPLIQEALDHREELANMNETLLEQMVENPAYFEGKDDDPLQIFTQGLGMVLPAVVSEKRLDKWSGYVRSILAQGEETQPKAIQKNRRALERLLRAWMPDMTPDQIFTMLEGGVSPQEAMGLIEQLPPGAMDKLDVGTYLAPLIAQGDYRAIRMLRRFQLSPAALNTLDTSVVQAMENGKMQNWHFQQYMASTQRPLWEDSSPLIERGLRSVNAKARDAFAQVAMQMRPGPDADWARTAISTYELSDNVVRRMKQKWKLP